MKKKYFYGSLIGLLGILGIWQLAVNAQTWSGPKPGCYDPSQTDCNVDGVIWNRSNTAIDTVPAQLGNYKITGRAIIGGNLEVASDGQAIRVDRAGSVSNFNFGNWGNVLGQEQPINVNIWGNLTLRENGANFTDPKLTTPKICLSGDCRTAWPVGGGGGGGTVTSVGSSNGLTGGPIVGAGSLSIVSCGEGKILKTVGGIWACADDADTNSGGTVTTISSSDTSINVTNGSGPVTNLGLNTGLLDARYVNVGGDTMSGTLNITPAAGYGLHVNSGGIRVEDGGITNVGFMQNYGQLTVNSAAATAIAAYGASYGAILSGGVNGLYAGSDTTGAGAYVFYSPVSGGAITRSVTMASNNYALDVWGADSRFQNNVDVYGVTRLGNNMGNWMINVQPAGSLINSLGTWNHTGAINSTGNISVTGGAGKITSGTFCIGVDCRNSWPTGDITEVLAGTGMTGGGSSGSVTLNVTDNYVNTAGDTMAGNLSFGSATRQMMNLWSTIYGIGVQSDTQYYRSNLNFAWYKGGAHGDAALDAGGGTELMSLRNGDLVANSNKWGTNRLTLAECANILRNPAGGPTQCAVGQYLIGINTNAAGTTINSIYCCPL